MNLLIADTRKDVGRGHQSRIQALHHALGGHIVEMDDSVPCGIRLDGELICQGLEYALIRPEVVALRPDEPMSWPEVSSGWVLTYPAPEVVSWLGADLRTWETRMAAARIMEAPCGVTALEACCLGVPLRTWIAAENQKAQYDALMQLSHEERFQVIDGKGADRVANAIKAKLQDARRAPNNPGDII